MMGCSRIPYRLCCSIKPRHYVKAVWRFLALREKEETSHNWDEGQAAWKNSALVHSPPLPLPISEIIKNTL